MKKTIRLFTLLVIILVVGKNGFSQNSIGKVYLIRNTGSNGCLIVFHNFYSIQTVEETGC